MGDGVDSDHRPQWTQGPWLSVLVGTLIVTIIGLIGLVILRISGGLRGVRELMVYGTASVPSGTIAA